MASTAHARCVLPLLALLGACVSEDAPLTDEELAEGEGEGPLLDEAPGLIAVTCGAKLAPASVTASGAQTGNPASNAIDGSLATRWSMNGVGSTITLDLGAVKPICDVKVAWYVGDTRTSRLTIAFSSDGSTFAQAYAGTSSGTTPGLEAYAASSNGARYVRLTVDGNSANTWASVSELQVSAQTGFKHPGILVDRTQLDFVKGKIAAGAQPWKAAFDKVKGSRFARATYTARPFSIVKCGAHNDPNIGCTEEMDDALAAYTNALLWYYTGQTAYADKAIEIMNAWSAVLRDHAFDTTLYSNGILQAGWVGQVITRAAEIIRHTSTRWAPADVARFTTMLNTAFLPRVIDGWPGGGNWNTTMAEATMNIGVFTDSRATFENGLADWRGTTRSLIYLTSDGPRPYAPLRSSSPGTWWGAKVFVEGLSQETCRDLSHTLMGIAGAVNAAETARIQGVDLYGEESKRLRVGMEFQAKVLNTGSISTSICPNGLVLGGLGYTLTGELIYNHYAGRLGFALPETKQHVIRHRPSSAALHMAWETLTHAVGPL